TGVLHHPSTPHIPGMETFQGALFDSAHWDHSVALDNRRIGVIGMGSTGVQIISALAGRAALVREDIQAIEANGIRTVDGHLHELDVIALATGFHPDRFMRPMRIVGRDGIDLETFWHDRPKAYLAVSMPGFPNFFMLNGPNGPVGNFTLIDIAEHQWRYIDQLIARIRNGECTEICASAATLERFETDRIAAAKTTIWYTGGCKSWYLDKEGIPSSWPWNYNRFVQEMSEPRWEDFDLV
ncbi:MAG: hypothetical protein ACPG1A_15025, partial [Halioglobus sp.]